MSNKWKTCYRSIKHNFIWIVFILGTLSGRTLFAQDIVMGTITGTITNDHGQALDSVTVNARHEASGTLYATTSDSIGFFTFINIRPGSYKIKALRYGFMDKETTETVWVKLGEIVELSLKLEPTIFDPEEELITSANTEDSKADNPLAEDIELRNEYIPFNGYKNNFFIFGGSPLLKNLKNTANYDIKFQLSFNYRTSDRLFESVLCIPTSAYLFFGYTQKSFWNILDKSAPFRENNYNPEISLRQNFSNWCPAFGYEHESNGRAGPQSRSWDRLFFTTNTISINGTSNSDNQIRIQGLYFIGKAWYVVNKAKKNKDILRYSGTVDLTLGKSWEKVFVEIVLRPPAPKRVKGSILTDIKYQVKCMNPYIFLQIFHGYGETLQNYDVKETKIRIGLALRSYKIIQND